MTLTLHTAAFQVHFTFLHCHFFPDEKFLFAVTLDYKALLLLLQKGDDEDFLLGGKGYDEFCAFCDAIRVSIRKCLRLLPRFDLYVLFPCTYLFKDDFTHD